jgi:hypothetical protein
MKLERADGGSNTLEASCLGALAQADSAQTLGDQPQQQGRRTADPAGANSQRTQPCAKSQD